MNPRFPISKLLGLAVAIAVPGGAFAQSALLPYVADANGAKIGFLLGKNSVVLKIPYSTVTLEATIYATGFTAPDGSFDIRYLFTTTNCTGTKYLEASGFPIHAYVNPVNPIGLQYAGANPAVMQVMSYRNGTAPCTPTSPVSVYAGPVANLSLKALPHGPYTPPFSIQYK